MYGEMMAYYGLTKDLDKADFFETETFQKTLVSLKTAINSGGIIALTGIVGSGKTTALRKIQQAIRSEGKVLVAKSLSTDKRRVNINTLYTALFSDLATAKDFKIPTQAEKRERVLQALVKKLKKPIALLIDEAHDLHWQTLTRLKLLLETIEDGDGVLSIIVAGHPKLANELNKPSMEEIGARTKVFHLDGLGSYQRQYIEWVLDNCSKEKVKPTEIISEEAIELFADRLITPLQVNHYLTQALVQGVQVGEKPVNVTIAKAVLSPDLDAIESKLARHGYNLAVLCECLNARRREVYAYLHGSLSAGRTEEFNKEIHKLGIL